MTQRYSHVLAAIIVIVTLHATTTLAEEGGSGHYLPGAMSSFIDSVPSDPTFIARYNFLYYNGDAGLNRMIPIAGLTTFGLDAESYANGLTLLWRPSIDLGNRWSFAVSATIPYVSMNVSADVAITPTRTIRSSDSIDGIGDIILMPLMVNFQISRDWSTNTRLGIYTPTGSYETGRLANAGKNFWTFEPVVALMYFGKENGRELSVFTGIDFNTENPDTNYQSGIQAHIDGTAAQHFPLFGGLLGIGASGYWYEQITGDSGSGATFGDFEGRTAGLGPVVSYSASLGNVDIVAELKWLHEFETRNRLEGDYVWLKFLCKF